MIWIAETYETNLDTFYVVAADYAMNEALYMVTGGEAYLIMGNVLNDGGRTIIGRQMIDWSQSIYDFRWVKFNADTHNYLEGLTESDDELTYATTYGYDFTDGLVADDGTVYVATIEDLYILDPETWEVTWVITGTGTGYLVHGLFFKDEMKPKDYWVVKELIDAIGEVGAWSKEAIEAVREAYDALTEKEQARVDNYETLLAAEREYLTLMAEEAALNAAKAYALLVVNDLEKDLAGDTCSANILDAAREAINYATTLDEVYAILDEVRFLVAQGCVSKRFSDVAVNAWYHNSVEFVVTFGLMEGMGNGTFAPEASMTRAQIVTVLYRLAGEPEVEGMTCTFTDVPANTWYTDAVIWAANNGIVNGTSKTTFAPNDDVTREQLVTILHRFFGEPAGDTNYLAGYADANTISDYAREAMAWAVEYGVVNGMTETTLAPKDAATRAQVATILMRLILD